MDFTLWTLHLQPLCLQDALKQLSLALKEEKPPSFVLAKRALATATTLANKLDLITCIFAQLHSATSVFIRSRRSLQRAVLKQTSLSQHYKDFCLVFCISPSTFFAQICVTTLAQTSSLCSSMK